MRRSFRMLCALGRRSVLILVLPKTSSMEINLLWQIDCLSTHCRKRSSNFCLNLRPFSESSSTLEIGDGFHERPYEFDQHSSRQFPEIVNTYPVRDRSSRARAHIVARWHSHQRHEDFTSLKPAEHALQISLWDRCNSLIIFTKAFPSDSSFQAMIAVSFSVALHLLKNYVLWWCKFIQHSVLTTGFSYFCLSPSLPVSVMASDLLTCLFALAPFHWKKSLALSTIYSDKLTWNAGTRMYKRTLKHNDLS